MNYQHFRDFDAFAASVRDVDCTMMLQNPKHYSWSITHVNLPESRVQMGKLGSGNIVEGQSISNGYVIYMPLTNKCEYSANGTVLERNSFMILEPGCDFCVSTKDKHDWCSITVPTHMFARGEELVERSSDCDKMKCRVTSPNPQLAEQFRAVVGQIVTVAANWPKFEIEAAGAYAEAELLQVASLIVGQPQAGEPNQNKKGRQRLPRQEIIRHSQELLEERDGKLILVGELADSVGVSERTLRTVFNEYFGVGPVRYLQLRQLHQVRSALRSAEPEAVSVRDVLLRQGVRELGRFASRYRRVFGELPSETMRKKSRAVSF